MPGLTIPPGLVVDVQARVLPGRPALVLSSGFGIFGFDEPIQVSFTQLLQDLEVGWVQYTYAERNANNHTTDLLMSTAAAALDHVCAWTRSQGATKLGLFGISFGATISLELSIEHDIPLLILVNPVVDYVDFRSRQLGESAISTWEERRSATLDYGGREVSSGFRFMEEARGQRLIERLDAVASRVLIVQAALDEILGITSARVLASRLQDGQLYVVDGADHTFDSDDAVQSFLRIVEPEIRDWRTAL